MTYTNYIYNATFTSGGTIGWTNNLGSSGLDFVYPGQKITEPIQETIIPNTMNENDVQKELVIILDDKVLTITGVERDLLINKDTIYYCIGCSMRDKTAYHIVGENWESVIALIGEEESEVE